MFSASMRSAAGSRLLAISSMLVSGGSRILLSRPGKRAIHTDAEPRNDRARETSDAAPAAPCGMQTTALRHSGADSTSTRESLAVDTSAPLACGAGSGLIRLRQDRRKASDSRARKESRIRELAGEFGPDAADEGGREEGVAAEVEEAVVDADAGDAEYFGEQGA